MNAKVIGNNVRLLREGKRLSQSQLGEAIFLCQTRVSRIEKGEHVPPAEVLERIADYFEVSIVFLNTKNHMNTGNGFDPRPYGPAIELSTLNEEPLHLSDAVPLRVYLELREESKAHIRFLEKQCKELMKTIKTLGRGIRNGGGVNNWLTNV